QKRLTEAVELVQGALAATPNPHPDVIYIFGLLCAETGDPNGVQAALAILSDAGYDARKIEHLRSKSANTAHVEVRETAEVRTWGDNEITILCARAGKPWSPLSLERGVGGSEEAVIRLGRELALAGWKVTVFAEVGDEGGIYDGVDYRPLDELNLADRFNVVMLWRTVHWVDADINARGIYAWLHDVPDHASFTRGRVDRLTGILVLSEFHRSTLAHVPDEKFVITGNGIDVDSLDLAGASHLTRNPQRCVYASSYNRGLEVLLEIWPEVRAAVPNAELHAFYGWNSFEKLAAEDPEVHAWMVRMKALTEQPGVFEHGRVSQQRIIEENFRAGIWAYPSTFEETSCITAMKAQACGAVPVVYDLAALKETVRWGEMVPSGNRAAYTRALIALLQDPERQDTTRREMMPGAKEAFSWTRIAEQWTELFHALPERATIPTLSVCLIAKNEEARLARCLESVRGIADEIILVDTGSEDQTKDIAAAFGARIHEMTWPNDFAVARNVSLAQASCDWILVLDADEVLAEEHAEALKASLKDDSVDAYRLIQRSFRPEGEVAAYEDVPLTRLFRNDARYRYEQPIHEQILPSIHRADGRVVDSSWVLLHDGYLSSVVQGNSDRGTRNLSLLQIAARTRPNDAYLQYQLGVTYKNLGQHETAVHHLRKADQMGMQGEGLEAQVDLQATLAQLALGADDYAEAELRADKVLSLMPGHVVGSFVKAIASMYRKRWEEALPVLENLVTSEQCHDSVRPRIHVLLQHCARQAA
ncbi:MAG: glycosyltransferase, partial [Rhodothermales bacterium]|nr:glycosyltransferase [Rhodothermales bacterium]